MDEDEEVALRVVPQNQESMQDEVKYKCQYEDEYQPSLLLKKNKTLSLEGMGLRRRQSYSHPNKNPLVRRTLSYGGATVRKGAPMETYSYYTHHSHRYLNDCREMESLLIAPPNSSPSVSKNYSNDGLLVQDYGGLRGEGDAQTVYRNEVGSIKTATSDVDGTDQDNSTKEFIYCIAYALINTTMSVPCLYGYASVIFSHPFFQPNMASLSKLVIWSSAIHQFVFVAFSSLSFAKAEVQDAGLIFLSSMGRQIADSILSQPGEIEQNIEVEIISTTIVALGLATASLGVVLVCMGHFHCANAVSYLPLPVVGGYLAFIGYFCLVAGVGLCVSKNMADEGFFVDLKLLMDRKSFLLATPGLISGCLLTVVARSAQSEVALPGTMIAIPLAFYGIMYACGLSMEEMREAQWVGEAQPPAPATALLDLLDFNKVRWEVMLDSNILSTWLGMVFVVSFSSCLDVAAISIDMGAPLDVNKELTTVGLSNIISGLLYGQTGSYIFSQTIFTYRTGYHSRWVGFLGALSFLILVVSKINLLEISPLFFLGSTLIFIGIDLLYEWLLEVRHKLLLSEYIVLLATFIAIQVVGINGGIVFGILVAVVDHVVTTAKTSSIRRILKRSKLAWQPDQRKLLDTIYDSPSPKILTLELRDTIFFGSSLQLLTNIGDEIGMSASPKDILEISITSPRYHGHSLSPHHQSPQPGKDFGQKVKRQCPKFVVLDLTAVPNVDASAARGCFLQLAKMCQQHDIVLCASGANSRVDWILRSHEAAHTYEDEEKVKESLLNPIDAGSRSDSRTGMVLLFDTLLEALELCENNLIQDFQSKNNVSSNMKLAPQCGLDLSVRSIKIQAEKTLLSTIFSRILGMKGDKNEHILKEFDGLPQIEEMDLVSGDTIFVSNTIADSFYVVLAGTVCIFHEDDDKDREESEVLISGAGSAIQSSRRRHDEQLAERRNVISFLNVGGIFGFVDFKLDRRRSFSAASSRNNTIVAKISHTTIDYLSTISNSSLNHVIDLVLLQASLMELANLDVT